MEELALLEAELLLIQNNILRVQRFFLDNKPSKSGNWTPYSSHVFGELKHRLVSLKQRCVIINKMSTNNLFK